MGAGAAINALTLGPNLYPLVLSRLNRHTLGQALSFFDDDFAGRIAAKQQQTARALTEAVSETVNTLGLALTAIVGAMAVVGGVDGWLAVAMARLDRELRRADPPLHAAHPHPLEGAGGGAGGGDRAGRRHHHQHHHGQALQPRPARGPGGARRARRLPRRDDRLRATTSAAFRFWLMALAGMLPVVLIGGTLLLWTRGAATAGDIATAGLIATRLAQMSGWVSMTAMGVFSNVGEVEDGMRTLSPPHTIVDAAGAMARSGRAARSTSSASASATAGRTPALEDSPSTSARRAGGARRALGRRQDDGGLAAPAALRGRRRGASCSTAPTSAT